MSRAVVTLGVVLVGLSAPAGRGGAEPAPIPRAEDLLKDAGKIVRRTAQLRGLRVRRKIKMGLLSRAELLQRIEQKIDRAYGAAQITGEAGMLKRLGLLPEALDYRKAVLALHKDQVAGYYDPGAHRLHLANWVPMTVQEPALAHEICHALQDQHFRLARLTRPIKDNSDAQLARMALVEGDCTGVMLEYMLRDKGLDLSGMPVGVVELARKALVDSGSATFRAAPAILRETLLFPYVYGLGFMRVLRTRRPWHVVNRMYRRPPRSTEQMIHYRKYWARERPVRVSAADPDVLSGYSAVKRDVLGEFQLSVYLGLGVSGAVASRAAAGWGGDRLVAYGRKGEPGLPLLVHLTTWDSRADALEFANAQRHVFVARKLRELAADPAGRSWSCGDRAGARWLVQLHGRHVLVLHGVPARLLSELQQQVWSGWRVGGRRIKPPPAPGPQRSRP